MFDLVRKYKIKKEKEFKKILSIYFGRYSIYRTFEPRLIKTYALIKDESIYKKETKRWRVILTKENPDLKL